MRRPRHPNPARSRPAHEHMSRRVTSGMAESSSKEVDEQEEEAVMVGPGSWSDRNSAYFYTAVDFAGERYRTGDHIAVHSAENEGSEDYCVIQMLYQYSNGVPMFKGKWLWRLRDIRSYKRKKPTKIRDSKHEKYELLLGDVSDFNKVTVISRKIVLLSWKTFDKIRARGLESSDNVFYCDRLYFHRVGALRKLTKVSGFREDPVPEYLLKDTADGHHTGNAASISEDEIRAKGIDAEMNTGSVVGGEGNEENCLAGIGTYSRTGKYGGKRSGDEILSKDIDAEMRRDNHEGEESRDEICLTDIGRKIITGSLDGEISKDEILSKGIDGKMRAGIHEEDEIEKEMCLTGIGSKILTGNPDREISKVETPSKDIDVKMNPSNHEEKESEKEMCLTGVGSKIITKTDDKICKECKSQMEIVVETAASCQDEESCKQGKPLTENVVETVASYQEEESCKQQKCATEIRKKRSASNRDGVSCEVEASCTETVTKSQRNNPDGKVCKKWGKPPTVISSKIIENVPDGETCKEGKPRMGSNHDGVSSREEKSPVEICTKIVDEVEDIAQDSSVIDADIQALDDRTEQKAEAHTAKQEEAADSVIDVDGLSSHSSTEESVSIVAVPEHETVCIDVDADCAQVVHDESRVFDVDSGAYCA